jgi:hypothetical protein
MRFICLLWCWRLLLWSGALWKFSRLNLALHGAHPDGCGGLGFLSYAQRGFSVLALVTGILISGYGIDQALYYHATLTDLRQLLLAAIVVIVVVLLLPMLLVSGRLVALKRESLLAYGVVGTDSSEKFERTWLGRNRGDAAPILETGDPSALTDFTGVYSTVSDMTVLPFKRDLPLSLALTAALPMLPVLLVTTPLPEIMNKLASVLA